VWHDHRYHYARSEQFGSSLRRCRMSDTNHSSSRNVLDFVEEILAARPVTSKAFGGRKRKYRGQARKGPVRLLNLAEVCEFKAHVRRCMESRS
jgi:hypothetical protein